MVERSLERAPGSFNHATTREVLAALTESAASRLGALGVFLLSAALAIAGNPVNPRLSFSHGELVYALFPDPWNDVQTGHQLIV
jgi:hypothetical protein